ncbi:MAG: YggS family pyridoxal phosphate-dependent enzyme [Anaerolineales bacterium]|jgi:PLP dependent protein
MNNRQSNPETSLDLSVLPERIHSVRARIRAAAEHVHRNPSEIRLIAVSKGQPVTAVQKAFFEGLCEFGENYLEEALPKIHLLSPAVTWHMIGHVQGRKAKSVTENFPCVHSVDSMALARRLSRFAEENGRTIRILLECNLSGEATKYGWSASDPSAWESLWPLWREIFPLPGLSLAGLMTMAPYSDDPETSRPIFRSLKRLQAAAREHVPGSDWTELSMGMSDDFEQAVEEGATMVRIGRALFGTRP